MRYAWTPEYRFNNVTAAVAEVVEWIDYIPAGTSLASLAETVVTVPEHLHMATGVAGTATDCHTTPSESR